MINLCVKSFKLIERNSIERAGNCLELLVRPSEKGAERKELKDETVSETKRAFIIFQFLFYFTHTATFEILIDEFLD